MPTSVAHFASEVALRSTLVAWSKWFWQLELRNPDALPEGPCFIYGNHSHNLDPFFLNAFMPWGRSTAGIMTLEYFRHPLLAAALRSVHLFPTRKTVPEPHLIRTIYRLLEEKKIIVIYPEGGRRWDGRPKPWQPSTAKIFVKAGVPVYPVRTHGSYVGWPRWATYPRRARIQIEIGEPLQFDRRTPLDEALPQLKAPIAFDENRVSNAVRPTWAFRPAAGIHKLLYADPFTGDAMPLTTDDGCYVTNHAQTVRLRMQPDSSLLDERSGEVYYTGDLYEEIRARALHPLPDGALLRTTVHVHIENEFPTLIPLGLVAAALFPDHLHLPGVDAVGERIPLTDIPFWGIEKDCKLQLTLPERMVQLSFRGAGSALQWQDALRRLKHAM